MRPGSIFSTPLIIATMAFAVVAFLFLIDTSINPDGTRQSTNSPINQNNNATACAQDAKLCPDGSYVGRTGPNCAFAPCPGTNRNADFTTNTNSSINTNSSDPTAGWKTYTNATYGYSIKYPAAWMVTELSNVVQVSDSSDNNQAVLICPDNTGTDCPPTQDAQYISTSSTGTLSDRAVAIRSDSLTSTDCLSCAPKMKAYNFTSRPRGWKGSSDFSTNRDILSRSDANGSFTENDLILSTLTFTN